MTPLLGTKTSSAPVGANSGGDRRAARSLLSCALWRGMGRLWRGMGRLWRGMGGMVRPEPLSAHRPHRQQGLSGFHETRDTNHGFFSVGARGWRHRKPPSGPLPPPASRCLPVHHCSPLFTIVHYCSPLFAIVRHCSPLFTIVHQKYCPAPVPSCRPVAAFVRVVARYGRPWRGMGGILPPRQRPCPVRRSRWPRGERRSPQLSSPSGLMRYCPDADLSSVPPPLKGPAAACWRFALGRGMEQTPESLTAGQPWLLADSTHGAGRAKQLGCGRRAGFFTMLTRRREPRRQEQPRKSRTLFQDSP